ncbi:methyltransferase domain containing protein [Nitzschia inconspicua]|uniref:Methyltransferase domain containing protein n=1 Tax=Nitzschia inconspicua TaxID=303405 RepID=A0A9K3PKZ4_9STRA|nr:methyltransferase domain containing protein [Nitzschia inconspicua]
MIRRLFIFVLQLALYQNKSVQFADAWTQPPPSPNHRSTIATFRQSEGCSSLRQSAVSTTEKDASTDSAVSSPPPLIQQLESPIFGRVARIRMPGEGDNETDNEQSFVGAMGVPTFATIDPPVESTKYNVNSQRTTTRKRGLEGALNHGPALVVDHVLSKDICEQMIQDAESLGFGNFDCGRNHHGALQLLVDQSFADQLGQALAPHIDVQQVEDLRREMIRATNKSSAVAEEDTRLVFQGLNRRWRIYRYAASGNETFAPHIDAGFPPSGLSDDQTTLVWDTSEDDNQVVVSRLTVLIYLNDDFVGGETNFYRPLSMQGTKAELLPSSLIASVRPVAGSVLLFPQGVGEDAVDYARKAWPLHEGSPVVSGRPKYIIRSDAIFVTQQEKLLLDNELYRFDHLVRDAFLPTSRVFQPEFLSHASSLYNPHMGVENLGPFLYNFIRMTKKRQIVEIGAGYTSLWILQALKDNDDELYRIKNLQDTGKCKLLDIDWTVDTELKKMLQESSRLLCVDNCEHQKETATGASAVAKSLGLEEYFEFRKGDAFDLDLGNETVDALWCDFGVGSRMSDFMTSAWSCIRPGGFLLCHSTLTNENTRKWLESVRRRQPKEVTGIEPTEYVELSLLEPHKRYQNSVSIIQKRKSVRGETFEEPTYSKFA